MTEHNDKILIMLGGLEKSGEMIIRALSEDRTAAAQYRTDVRNEIAGLRREYHVVQSDLNIIKAKVESMEPKVEKLEQKDFTHEGAKKAAISIGTVFGKALQFLVAALGGMGGGAIIDRLLHK